MEGLLLFLRPQMPQLSALGVPPFRPKVQKVFQVDRRRGGRRQRTRQARLSLEWGPRRGRMQLPDTLHTMALLLQALLGTFEVQVPRPHWQEWKVEEQQQEQQGRLLQQTEPGMLLDQGRRLLLELLAMLSARGQGQWWVLVWCLLQAWQGLGVGPRQEGGQRLLLELLPGDLPT